MKKITIVAASKVKSNSSIFSLVSEYTKRFTNFQVNILDFDEKNMNKDAINTKIFTLAPEKSYKIMLSEEGKLYTTSQLKDFVINIQNSNICFLIAGSDGFNQKSKEKVDAIISLSKLTFPHQIARLLLIEQLYRVQSIINNHPYHRE